MNIQSLINVFDSVLAGVELNDSLREQLTAVKQAFVTFSAETEKERAVVVATVRKLPNIPTGENHRFIIGRPFPQAKLKQMSVQSVSQGASSSLCVIGHWEVPESVVYESVASEYEGKGQEVSAVAAATGDIPLEPSKSWANRC